MFSTKAVPNLFDPTESPTISSRRDGGMLAAADHRLPEDRRHQAEENPRKSSTNWRRHVAQDLEQMKQSWGRCNLLPRIECSEALCTVGDDEGWVSEYYCTDYREEMQHLTERLFPHHQSAIAATVLFVSHCVWCLSMRMIDFTYSWGTWSFQGQYCMCQYCCDRHNIQYDNSYRWVISCSHGKPLLNEANALCGVQFVVINLFCRLLFSLAAVSSWTRLMILLLKLAFLKWNHIVFAEVFFLLKK